MDSTSTETRDCDTDKVRRESPAELVSALGAGQLQRMQDTFAAIGRVTLHICDPEGRPLTTPSGAAVGAEALISLSKVLTDPSSHSCPSAGTFSGVTEVGRAGGMQQYVAPIRLNGRHVGTIVLVDSLAETEVLPDSDRANAADRRRWEDITRFLRLMSERLATLCDQRAQMIQRISELEAVHDLTAMFAGTENLKDSLRKTAERLCRVMRIKACSIRLLDKASGELRIEAGHNLSSAYLNKGPVLLGENPNDIRAMRGETVYIADVPSDPGTRYPEQARAEGLVSGLCVPMIYGGEAIGVIRLYTGRRREFSGFQCALLRSVGSQIAAAISVYRLHQEGLAAQLHQRQLRNAAAIQRRMIPDERRTHGQLSFGCVYKPALNVGGDFFDFIELPRGNLGFCVADVVGKGISAALMMASVRAALRAHAHSIYNLDEVVGLVNNHLCRDTLSSEFATLFYGVFSAEGMRLTYCNAGHEPGLLFRGDRVTELTTGGMVIGVEPETDYRRGIVDLHRGDILVTCTDGVVEALDFDDRLFGRERLVESVRKYADLDALNLAKQILWDVRRFVGLAPRNDDITIVVAKVSR